ncbi:OLC1v1000030C4 [Oldenlandia corymbosa var. corymbosa]|uniref:RING-type E3 ubiquitin transferase n=1 Tax=Oldenlandia corymbosa var. corymbosa TaxID=529605 RepID=A0AAV1D1Z6_OLDCO|nr:OLC1v1000030C4 [Oldenlandia corymbosa var. corymbosa]
MGGCCCSSRKPQFHGTPVYYYCPSVSEEHESLTSNDSAATALTAGFLVDLNLDTSIPDTFRSPPTPIPFDVVLGHPPTAAADTAGEPGNESMALKESHFKADSGFLLASAKKIDSELLKSDRQINPLKADEEADICPTCLEDYDAENPRIVTKCNHHFHLSCILEWMERSNTCPICDQVYEHLFSIFLFGIYEHLHKKQ